MWASGAWLVVQASKLTRYRQTAAAIRETAEKTTDPGGRAELLALAERYDRMAAHAEHQSDAHH